MLYGGDADLTKEQNGTDNYTLGKDGIHAADKNLSDKANNLLYVYTVGRCGVNQTTYEIDPNLTLIKLRTRPMPPMPITSSSVTST